MITENFEVISKLRKITVVLFFTVIHTFGAAIKQFSLAIEIMAKCSHAGPSNKTVIIF